MSSFVFQQRTGRLDLRSLAKIDLDSLVRHCDIDSLQNHVEEITFMNLREEDLRLMTDPHVIKLFRVAQLMIEYLIYAQEQLALNLNRLSGKYTEQKRTLTRKRRELAELLETTRHLETEVSSKKKGLTTLETMLKEVSAARGLAAATAPSSSSVAAVAASAQPKDEGVSFYVTAPNGCTVECSEPSGTTVEQLVSKISPSLNLAGGWGSSTIGTKLVYQGKTLQPDALISSLCIRSGDSIMAIVDQKASHSAADAGSSSSSRAHLTANELKELFSQQHESLKEVAVEIRQGWEAAMKSIAPVLQRQVVETSSQPAVQSAEIIELQVFEKMDERWGKLENAMRKQLDQQLSLYTQHLQELAKGPSGHRIHAGDMEDDDETNASEGIDYKKSLTFIEQTVKGTALGIDEMRIAHSRQSLEIAELKKLFSHEVEHVAFSATEEQPEHNREAESEHEVVDFQNDLSASVEVEKDDGEKKVKVEPKYPNLKISPPRAAARVAETVVEDLDVTDEKSETSEPSESVCVIFPVEFNSDIASVLMNRNTFTITVPSDLSIDDVIFEMRRAVADLAATSLQKVALNLRGKIVTLGVDVDQFMTPAELARLAASGELIIKLSSGNTMSDEQIDILVEEWQRSQQGPVSNLYDRESGFGLEEEDRMMDEMRSSLTDALSDIKGLSGLSNEDLQRRVNKLHSTASILPRSVADTLMDARKRNIEALSNLSSDRESSGDEGEGVTLSIARKKSHKEEDPRIYVIGEDDEERENFEVEQSYDEISMTSGERWDGRIGESARYGDDVDLPSPKASLTLNFDHLANKKTPLRSVSDQGGKASRNDSPFHNLATESAGSSLNLSESSQSEQSFRK